MNRHVRPWVAAGSVALAVAAAAGAAGRGEAAQVGATITVETKQVEKVEVRPAEKVVVEVKAETTKAVMIEGKAETVEKAVVVEARAVDAVQVVEAVATPPPVAPAKAAGPAISIRKDAEGTSDEPRGDGQAAVGAGPARITVKVAAAPAKPRRAVALQKRAGRAQAVAVAVNANQQNLDPWIQQMTPQLRPMVRAHLHLIATACAPTAEQRKAFAAEGEDVLKAVARDCAAAQMGQGQPNAKGMGDPARMIARRMAESLKGKLSPEQQARYDAENIARDEARRRLVIRNLVSTLDDELVLSPDQRARIGESLEAKYDESWCSTLQVLMYGAQFFPAIPDDLILPALTPGQKAAWTKRARNGTMAWWNFGHNGNGAMIDPIDAEPDGAKPGGGKAAAKDQQPAPES